MDALVTTCAQIYFFFLEDFLAICSKIKEIRLVKKKCSSLFFDILSEVALCKWNFD